MKNMNNISNKNNSEPHHYQQDGTPVYTKEQIKEHWHGITRKVGAVALIAATTFGVYQVTKTPDAHPSNETVQLQPGQTRWDIANQVKDNYNSQKNFKKIDTGDALTAINEINPNDDGVDQAGDTVIVPQFDKW